MSPAELVAAVKSQACALGFDLCGIAPAAPIPRGEYLRDWLAEGRAGDMGYLHRHVDSRIDVRAWLPWARSIIVTALNYHQPEPGQDSDSKSSESWSHGQAPLVRAPEGGMAAAEGGIAAALGGHASAPLEPCHSEASPKPQASILSSPRGRVAMYAWGADYHVVVRDKLSSLLTGIRNMVPVPFEARVCVDTSAIVERELAAAAGIGWIGKNTLVLHPGLGSFFFLGEIITSLDLPPDAPQPDHCGSCTRCLDACPTNAFPAPYTMDARYCISYLTIEHRGDIESELAARMDDWVFGCDVCQTVCPYNRDSPTTREPRFRAQERAARLVLTDLLAEDDAASRVRTAGSAQSRAKPHMWKRNAAIALRNHALRGPSSTSH